MKNVRFSIENWPHLGNGDRYTYEDRYHPSCCRRLIVGRISPFTTGKSFYGLPTLAYGRPSLAKAGLCVTRNAQKIIANFEYLH